MRGSGGVPASVAVLALAGAGLLVAGCGLDTAMSREDIASTVNSLPTATGLQWAVSPWPFERSVAYLCTERPSELDVDRAPDPAICTTLDIEPAAGVLRASFDASRADPAFVQRLEATPTPILAVAGRDGVFSYAMTSGVADSPIPPDPGDPGSS